jgi:alpha-aminoadipate carrier protein LysW
METRPRVGFLFEFSSNACSQIMRTLKGFIMKTATCPECAADVSLADDVTQSEIVVCPDCGVELEVELVDPIKLKLAPTEQEDWGE